MASSSTIQLQNTVNWAQYFIGQRPLALYNGVDPALTIGNWIVNDFLTPPFVYRWNRAATVFQTIDPTGWLANTAYIAGYRIIDSNGNMQTVTTPGTSGATQPSWATSGTTTDNTITWTESLPSDYLQAVPNFGFIEKASLKTQGASPTFWTIPNIGEGPATSDTGTGRWQYIYPYLDDNQGNITFRPFPGIPDKLYTACVTYQKRISLMTALNQTWPLPDMVAAVYQTGFLGYTYMFVDDGKAAFFLQRYAAQLIAMQDGLTSTQKQVFMEQFDMLNQNRRASAQINQGMGARAAG